jgi:hypothetical protein
MPLKIRCPHCQRILRAEDWTAGQSRICPLCEQPFNVPTPPRDLPGAPPAPRPPPPDVADASLAQPPPAHDVAADCPRCHRPVAPGNPFCPRCLTDLSTGRRLPWRRRVAIRPLRTLLPGAIIIAAVAAAAIITNEIVGIELRARRAAPTPAATTTGPASAPAIAADAAAERLLAARTATQRDDALFDIKRQGHAGLTAVARSLDAALRSTTRRPSIENLRAALDLLEHEPDPAWTAALERCRATPELADAALCALARLNPPAHIDALVSRWVTLLRQRIFLDRLAALAPPDTRSIAQDVAQRARGDCQRFTATLRALAAPPGDALERAAARYWDSWDWLGQKHGEAFAAELFDIARPPPSSAMTNAEVIESVRTGRRVLEDAALRAAPPAAAALALTLAQCVPQYQSARGRVTDRIGAALASLPPDDQQRITWALAELTGRTFGDFTADQHPRHVRPAHVQAAMQWVHAAGGPAPARLAPDAKYPAPPQLVARIVTPQRRLEHQLLRQLSANWSEVDAAVDAWLAANLGCTPRLLARLDPAQRQPDYPALAAALTIVAAAGCDDASIRRQLTLWRQAADQPAWLRALAEAVGASLDSRAARLDPRWPTLLSAEAAAQFDAGRPGWRCLGRVLAAGSPPLRARLNSPALAMLPAEALARLRAAVQDAERSLAAGGAP